MVKDSLPNNDMGMFDIFCVYGTLDGLIFLREMNHIPDFFAFKKFHVCSFLDRISQIKRP